MYILSVDNVLQEDIEYKDVLINNFEFLVEDDARNGSDNDINNPPSVHDRPCCPLRNISPTYIVERANRKAISSGVFGYDVVIVSSSFSNLSCI